MENLFDIELTLRLLGLDFVRHALLASALLGLVAGALGPLIVMRRMAFAVHGTAELAFTGAAAALLLGMVFEGVAVEYGAIAGAVLAALLLGILGGRSAERDSVIGVVLAFGLGVGVLLLWLYPGRAHTQLGLFIGQVISIDRTNLAVYAVSTVAVLGVLALLYRPLLFASADPVVAAARGVPVSLLTPLFAVLVGIATALGVQTVGMLLVLALLVTPAAAACRVTSSPTRAIVLAIAFAELAVLGGIVLSLAPGVPISAFVTAISFAIYLSCRLVEHLRARVRRRKDADASEGAATAGAAAPAAGR
ncbi:metal ABC transporter permease [Haloechinothrix sp. YIM 98757]|uniref:Metal ABC transporter permease n=1 Tax=Haloechinothrix aidingensis TaxID=2752311 RepID=A0A838AET1_9PSEU|nr:metal ABC transporter permease [Haloechinothrix aidingensis]MBA0127844.1 metal ABC transporter permease [Haloechinothrix aidingensis]